MLYVRTKFQKKIKIVPGENIQDTLWVKFSYINILSVNTASLKSDLFQECSKLVPTIQVLKYLTLWSHSSLLLVPEQLDTRVPFEILCPAKPTQPHIPVILGRCSDDKSLWSSIFFLTPSQPALNFLSPDSTTLNPWLYGERGDKEQSLHSHFRKS